VNHTGCYPESILLLREKGEHIYVIVVILLNMGTASFIERENVQWPKFSHSHNVWTRSCQTEYLF
jgi:hypothetical protein